MTLRLYNTRTRKKQIFRRLNAGKPVRMYVCGPTVYDYAHIGNARPVIVFDVLFRLLRHLYGPENVIYVRNITDVDDKINARAAERGIPIGELTAQTTKQFHEDIRALGVLMPEDVNIPGRPPVFIEPRATGHIEEMKAMVEVLVKKGCAYVAEDHVLFHVAAMKDYGALSRRSVEEMRAGARVEVAPYKRDPMDFVLWKPSTGSEPAWPSPCGIKTPGRPGWHLECSAMSGRYLGETFDIHAGGIDLVFPHHENEVAQSRCAHGTPIMANFWMHNGHLQVEGEKMSKSLGNFVTINELLNERQFGGQPWHGKVIRLAMLATHYRQPLDWTVERLTQARSTLLDWALFLHDALADEELFPEFTDALSDDLNTPAALAILYGLAKGRDRNLTDVRRLKTAAQFLGLYANEKQAEFALGLEAASVRESEVKKQIDARLAARKAKNWAEADRIRDELAAMGISLKDSKDPKTGEIVTTWEIAR